MDRRWMIFGNAVLFSAAACDYGGGGEPTPDAERELRDSRVAADADPADSAADPDLAAADMAPELDMDPEPDMDPELDMAPGFDMGAELDMSLDPDMASEPDLSLDPDQFAEVDMAPEPDLAPPDPDMALVPDLGPPVPDMAPPAMCGDLIGQPCQVNNEGCCPDGQNPQAVCWGDANGRMVWQSIPGDFFCNCAIGPDQTTYQVICAVPGFVGVSHAGRRLRGPRLRALLAA